MRSWLFFSENWESSVVKEYRMSKPRLTFLNNSNQPYPAWSMSLLKDAVEINPKTDSLPNQFIYIDLESVQSGTLISTKIYEKQDAPSRAQRLLKAHDVLFQMVRPYQKNNYFFELEGSLPAVSSTGYAQLRATENCPKFIYYTLHTNKFVRSVLDRCTGGAYPAINSSDLGRIVINIPCKEEQQKIAAFFTALDEQISIATRKCQLFKFLKKGIANSFFEDCALDCFKKIGTFARTFAGATPSTSNKEYWDGGAIPWMSSGEVNNRYIRSVKKSITSLGFDKTSTKMVKRGSTLIALAGQGKTRGKVAFTEMELCTNQSLAAIECDRNEVNDKYLFFFLETQYENLRALSTGDGGRGGLNLFIINNFEVPVISLHEQERIVSVLELIDKKIELAEMKLNVAERLKKAFMQQMFV